MALSRTASISPMHAKPPATTCVRGFEQIHALTVAAVAAKLPVTINPAMPTPAAICTVGLDFANSTCGWSTAKARS